tara:strand:+ start:50 stop:517 length:468 start_codon:yes stop_codon:yes gene_type:complete
MKKPMKMVKKSPARVNPATEGMSKKEIAAARRAETPRERKQKIDTAEGRDNRGSGPTPATMKKRSMARKKPTPRQIAMANAILNKGKSSMTMIKKSMAKLKKNEKSAMAMKKKGAMMMKKASAMTMKTKKSMATMKKKSAMMMKKMAAAKMMKKR